MLPKTWLKLTERKRAKASEMKAEPMACQSFSPVTKLNQLANWLLAEAVTLLMPSKASAMVCEVMAVCLEIASVKASCRVWVI